MARAWRDFWHQIKLRVRRGKFGLDGLEQVSSSYRVNYSMMKAEDLKMGGAEAQVVILKNADEKLVKNIKPML